MAAAIALDALKVGRARKAGILLPIRAYVASQRVEIPYYVACSFLEQESGGGQNVFGHDPTIFVGAGEVTRKKYLEYKKQRGHTRMQGVGPMQLTYWSYQDEADSLGGCWRPFWNMIVGFRIVRGHHDLTDSWREAARLYNGSGPAAEEYADQMTGRYDKWRKVLNG